MTETKQRRTFVVHVEDEPGVLNRVASLFRRRAYNIDSLNVARTHEKGVSRMTIVCMAGASEARRIEANLYKLVDVLRVDELAALHLLDLGVEALQLGRQRVEAHVREPVVQTLAPNAGHGVHELLHLRPLDALHDEQALAPLPQQSHVRMALQHRCRGRRHQVVVPQPVVHLVPSA